jgi:hypothetical protein
LSKHLPAEVAMGFLTIDVEGLDFVALISNVWDLFRPAYMLVESLDCSLEKVMQRGIFMFAKVHVCGLFARTYNTLLFRVQQDVMFNEGNA